LLLATLFLTLLLVVLFAPRGGDKTGQTADAPLKSEAVIYLDPGHGDFDFGAVATLNDGTALREKDLVLSLARDAAALLRARGYTVILSREGDERHTYTTSAAEVYARRDDAAKKGATHLISIHANAYAGEGRAFGARVYYDPEAQGASQAATCFAAAVTGATEGRALRECRTVPDSSYAILTAPDVTALLFECGFLSDPAERALLCDADYCARLASGIAQGIEAILTSK
jgi:N-acetylmuramoyl-L-alanine amidase